MIVEKQMYPQRATVWLGFWAGGIIGPYFFENEAGQPHRFLAVTSRHDKTVLSIEIG